jgi:hypothetical protein
MKAVPLPRPVILSRSTLMLNMLGKPAGARHTNDKLWSGVPQAARCRSLKLAASVAGCPCRPLLHMPVSPTRFPATGQHECSKGPGRSGAASRGEACRHAAHTQCQQSRVVPAWLLHSGSCAALMQLTTHQQTLHAHHSHQHHKEGPAAAPAAYTFRLVHSSSSH